MKNNSDQGLAHVNKMKVDDLKLFVADKPKLQCETSSSNLVLTRQLVNNYKFALKVYVYEEEQRIDNILFPQK